MKNVLCACVLAAGSTFAQAQLTRVTVASGLSGPVYVTHAGDDSGRLFVIEQAGRIRIVDAGGALLATPFLDITGPVRSGGERGLLGLAFHPDYAVEGADGENKFYVYYTGDVGAGDTFVSEFSAVSDTIADPSSERVLMQIDQPFSNHNGGWIGFGPDGYLYISTGDGGSGGDPGNRAANLSSMLGKMLRIDVDTQDTGLEYGIPADNAWANDGDSTTRDEIYHYGLRNAWRCSFDRDNGDMWLADVGQNAWEEVNHNVGNVGGLFYGWRCREGLVQYNGNCGASGWTDPQYVYNHSQGCSITGGYVYRGCELGTDFQGLYIFADYCTGDIWSLDPDNGYSRTTEFAAGFGVTSFGEDEDGELYYTSGSSVYKIVNPSAPDKDEDGIPDACAAGCPADLTDDGSLNFLDVSAFLSAFGKQNPIADFTGDGNYNFLDVSAFLAAFGEGCP
ncbi:MAG: PQQ-dependent sugar dehydrogenase [Phycisphaerales bacterium]|nr:PQQ-dependent sugar dehydrogenase [Phycisphaerales bacterium]